MYPNDTRIYKDIHADSVASTSAADIQAALNNSSDGSKWAAAIGGAGNSTYVFHILANGPSEPQTTITMTTGHTNPGPLPIGQFTNLNALTGGVGDEAMEMVGKGYSTASGCKVFDGFQFAYTGTQGTYSSTGMFSAYSACISDPSANMVSEVCNSNASLSGVEIAMGVMPEELEGTAGWTQGILHATIIEDPCASNYKLCEDGTKMRLRVCGYTDYAVGGNSAGQNCVNAPNQTTYPQAYAFVMSLATYGGSNTDNGCCLNFNREYQPQSGDAGFSFTGMPTIHLIDFDELSSSDSV
jgi:hypothetical protein